MKVSYQVKNTPKGLVFYNRGSYMTVRMNKKESRACGVKSFPADTPPEVVHLEISDRCQMRCSYCYCGEKSNREISTEDWKRIITQLKNAGVFQVTFGGGEPTMREDLEELARFVKSLELTLCMTSNGKNIPKIDKEVLRLFDQINVSWHNQKGFEKALKCLKKYEVRRGINFCLSKQYESDVELVRRIAERQEAEILFLTYKAVNNDQKNQIPPSQVLRIAHTIQDSGVDVAVDGATCQMCLGGRRFIDVSSVGDVMSCSFIRKPIGNLLKEGFGEIWRKRPKKVVCPYIHIDK